MSMFPKESYARCLPVILAGFLFLLTGFRFPLRSEYDQIETVDPDASAETRALYYNLGQLSEEHVLVGHQDALAYGVNWKDWHKRRSDMHDIYGQHPALVGWELSKLGSSALNIDSVRFDEMQGWIKQVYKMGGVNTISWHMGKSFANSVNSSSAKRKKSGTLLCPG
ncbi:MAG: glycosyl hydrolase, partial [Bacteroidota bacterium]